MTAPIPILPPGSSPVASYEQPFEMLDACHERVRRMLALLGKLRAHLDLHGADGQARQAARDLLRYFDQAAPEHHRDEERHVFPALRASGDARLVAVAECLHADHRAMERGWAALRPILSAVREGECDRLSPAAGALCDDFQALYARHIEDEETVAYPRARTRLDAAALQAMTTDMMARRGVR